MSKVNDLIEQRPTKIFSSVSLCADVTWWWKIRNFLCARESGESYMNGKISNCMNDPINGNATINAVGSRAPTLRRVFKNSYWLSLGSRVHNEFQDGNENLAQAIFWHSKQICNQQSKIETEKRFKYLSPLVAMGPGIHTVGINVIRVLEFALLALR